MEERQRKELGQEELLSLRKQAQHLLPLVRIGKAGLGQNILLEIVKQLKVHHLVKIKLLKNFMDDIPMTKRELADTLTEKTDAFLVSVVGNTVVLYRR